MHWKVVVQYSKTLKFEKVGGCMQHDPPDPIVAPPLVI